MRWWSHMFSFFFVAPCFFLLVSCLCQIWKSNMKNLNNGLIYSYIIYIYNFVFITWFLDSIAIIILKHFINHNFLLATVFVHFVNIDWVTFQLPVVIQSHSKCSMYIIIFCKNKEIVSPASKTQIRNQINNI